MIMKKRHAYNLAILLAAGSIMISACGKKTDVPADKTVPAQTESQTETSAEGTSSPEESSSETQVPGRYRKQQILYAPGNHYKN